MARRNAPSVQRALASSCPHGCPYKLRLVEEGVDHGEGLDEHVVVDLGRLEILERVRARVRVRVRVRVSLTLTLTLTLTVTLSGLTMCERLSEATRSLTCAAIMT